MWCFWHIFQDLVLFFNGTNHEPIIASKTSRGRLFRKTLEQMMAATKIRPSDTVAARVEHALNLTRGRLKLWLVFDDDSAVAEARTLIQQKKARHLLALSRNDLERRHEKAVREIMERYAGVARPAVSPPEPEAPKRETMALPETKPAPRRRAKSRQHAEALSG
jgi:hypothetical protein